MEQKFSTELPIFHFYSLYYRVYSIKLDTRTHARTHKMEIYYINVCYNRANNHKKMKISHYLSQSNAQTHKHTHTHTSYRVFIFWRNTKQKTKSTCVCVLNTWFHLKKTGEKRKIKSQFFFNFNWKKIKFLFLNILENGKKNFWSWRWPLFFSFHFIFSSLEWLHFFFFRHWMVKFFNGQVKHENKNGKQ